MTFQMTVVIFVALEIIDFLHVSDSASDFGLPCDSYNVQLGNFPLTNAACLIEGFKFTTTTTNCN